jgi:hypothetical protein
MLVITPYEIREKVIEPVFNNIIQGKTKISANYSISVLIELLKRMAQFSIPQIQRDQQFIIDFLISTKSFAHLQNLLQYQCFADDHQLALALIEIGCKPNTFPPAFQLGLDMLFRLKKFTDIIAYLLKSNMVNK